MRHELKTWPAYIQALLCSKKTFEVRRNDRGFKVGDILCLREWIPATKCYTGFYVERSVTYILQGEVGLPPDICVMAVVPVEVAHE
jgi:hypothetical protein